MREVLLISAPVAGMPSGLDAVARLRNYFLTNGAKIWQANASVRPQDGEQKKADILDFLDENEVPGRNKFIYIHGHMLPNGSIYLGAEPETYLHFAEFCDELREINAAGFLDKNNCVITVNKRRKKVRLQSPLPFSSKVKLADCTK